MKSFYDYMKKNDFDMYLEARKTDTEYRLRKVLRSLKIRQDNYKRKKLLLNGVFALLFSIGIISINFSFSVDVFADKESSTCEVSDESLEKMRTDSLTKILNEANEILNNIQEEQSKQEKLEEIKLKSNQMLKIGIESQLKASTYSNDLIKYVERVDLNVARTDIPMPVDHQEYLYLLCEERGLDFTKTLAVIMHESKFDQNAKGYNKKNGVIVSIDYGYMQINSGNHDWLTEATGTPNAPLNPYVNMYWGTYILSDLYSELGDEYSGDNLFKAVLSAYNRGLGGFRKYGNRDSYIDAVKTALKSLS